MPLDPDVQSLIDDVNAATETFARTDVPFSPTVLRDSVPFLMDVLEKPAQFPAVETVTDDVIVGNGRRVAVRKYEPADHDASTRTVVMMHGGGWMVGDLDTGDLLARHLCVGVGATVVSVDYPLAPEHAFPIAFEDCCEVVRSVRRSDRARVVAVAGDSAGGNLAAAIALAGRSDPELAVDGQLLIYPALDPGQSQPSQDRLADGYLLTRDIMAFYWANYLQRPADRQDLRAAPLMSDNLVASPAAVVVTAGFDPLQDEGRVYVQSLKAAGTQTMHLHEPTMIHGFVDQIGRVPAARQAVARMLNAFDVLLPGKGSRTGPADLASPTSEQPAI